MDYRLIFNIMITFVKYKIYSKKKVLKLQLKTEQEVQHLNN